MGAAERTGATVPGHSFMDGLRAVRREYRPRWRAAKGADQLDDGRRILAATKAAVVAARPAQAGRGYAYEQGSAGGREAIIANAVRAADAALREASPRRFWEAGDAVFTLISGPVDREDRRAGRPVDD
jgi:hypothetical protein